MSVQMGKNSVMSLLWKWGVGIARWSVVLFGASLGLILLAAAPNPRGSFGRVHFWDSAFLIVVGATLLLMAWATFKRSKWALVLAPFAFLGFILCGIVIIGHGT